MHKSILQILLLSFISSNTFLAQWTRTNGPGYSADVIKSFIKKDSYLFTGTYGHGVYRSSDNGLTWTQVRNGLTNLNVTCLACCGSKIFAGTWGGGVFTSINNGDSWIQSNAGFPTMNIYDLTISGNIIVCANDVGVYISSDIGNSWLFTISGDFVNLAADSLGSSSGNLYAACNIYNAGIHKSTNHGITWINPAVLIVGAYSVAASRDTIYAGTLDSIYRSTNGGVNWIHSSNGFPSTLVRRILITDDKILAGTSTGLFFSLDKGLNWTRYSSPMVQKNINTVFLNDGKMLAGTSDYGIMASTDNGTDWAFSNNGLAPLPVNSLAAFGQNIVAGTGAICFTNDEGIDWYLKKLASTVCMEIDGNNLYANTYTDSIFKSTDFGNTWAGFSASYPSVFAVNGNTVFVNIRSFDDKSHHINIIGDKPTGVYRSTDFGTTFTLVLSQPYVYALASSNNEVYAYTSSGGFKSTDNGNSWGVMNLTYGLWIWAFYFNGNYIFASSSYGVLRSEDDGASWATLNNGLTNININSIAFEGNLTFTASNDGVYASSNNGNQWFKISEGLPSDSEVISLAANQDFLFAGTRDRDVWRIPINQVTGITPSGSNIPDKYALYQNYPNPFNPSTKIKFDIPDFPLSKGVRGMNIRLKIYDILGREVATLVNQQLQPGTYNIQWNASNYPSGVYFYKLITAQYSSTRKLVLIK